MLCDKQRIGSGLVKRMDGVSSELQAASVRSVHQAASQAALGTPPATLIRWTHGLVNRLVMLADWAIIVLVSSAQVESYIWGTLPNLNLLQAVVLGVLKASIFVVLMRRMRAYRLERYARPSRCLADITAVQIPVVAFVAIIIFAFVPDLFPDLDWWVGSNALLFAALTSERQLARLLVHVVERKALLRRDVVVIGSGQRREEIVRYLVNVSVPIRYQLVGVFGLPDEPDPERIAEISVGGGPADLRRFAQTNPVDIIIIALPWERAPYIFRLVEELQWISADVVVPFDKDAYQPSFATIVDVGRMNALQLLYRPFKGSLGLLKLFEDYLLACILMIPALPIMLLAAVAVRLDSRGPILFRQARSGLNNKPFMIYKFRTMAMDPHDDGSLGTRGPDDPRITRVGKILRRLSLDELPQLFNVLRGEMSIVGPRPYVPNMLVGAAQFNEAVREYAARHRIKPGVTGWAQANGLRGGALRDVAQARRSVEMDMYYIANWSLWFDLRIIVRTIIIGMVGRNVF